MKKQPGWQEEMAVVTPESVSFSYEVAGIGSRFLALLVDHLIEGLVLVAVFLIFLRLRLLGNQWYLLLLAAGGTLFSLTYFVFFEIAWDGQSPGKRLMHLRVVRDGGYGLKATDSVLRNLLRLMDFLPVAYGLGLAFMFFSDKAKRLGDYAAGTLVVKDNSLSLPALALVADPAALAGLEIRNQALIRDRLSAFTPEQLRLMREFLRRRRSLSSPSRSTLAARLSGAIRVKIPELRDDLDAAQNEHLIEAVVAAHEERLR